MRLAQRVLAPLVVLAAFIVGAWALRWLTAGSLDGVTGGGSSGSGVTFDALLLLFGSVLAWGAYVWLALSFLLVVLSALPGAVGAASGALAERFTPAVCRRVLRVVLGITVVAGPVIGTAPAHAEASDPGGSSYTLSIDRPTGAMDLPSVDRPMIGQDANRAVPGIDQSTDALPSIDRPMGQDPVNRPPTRDADKDQEEQAQTHVVKRGDTLWDIAKDHLPEGASAAEINAEWQRWYEANKDVIGDDPDLILPGQIFQAPTDDR